MLFNHAPNCVCLRGVYCIVYQTSSTGLSVFNFAMVSMAFFTNNVMSWRHNNIESKKTEFTQKCTMNASLVNLKLSKPEC